MCCNIEGLSSTYISYIVTINGCLFDICRWHVHFSLWEQTWLVDIEFEDLDWLNWVIHVRRKKELQIRIKSVITTLYLCKIRKLENFVFLVASETVVMNRIDMNEKNTYEEFKSINYWLYFQRFAFSFRILTDIMQRKSAIANDYRRYTLKYENKAQVKVALQNIERK
jgi:hypothetical protein